MKTFKADDGEPYCGHR